MLSKLALSLLLIFAQQLFASDVTVVLDNNSTIIGNHTNSIDVFLGIPYAEPPVGDLRFKDSVMKGKFDQPFQAKELPNICYQSMAQFLTPGNMSEDCLYLSIYSPDVKGSYPVMFWIHGGGYTTGSGDSYPGNIFAMKYGVVLVSINYRLGPFGFLFDLTKNAPGNQGLKDQLLALKWVNENIDKFGGNKSSITIFGESAGSGSVSYHVLSPMSKGYFQRAIMESGTANAPWSYQSPALAAAFSNELSKNVKCADDKTGVECLKDVDAAEIIQAQEAHPLLIGPTVDGGFVTANPETLINSKKYASEVDMIVGFNENEGWLFVPMMWPEFMNVSDNGKDKDFCTRDELVYDAIKSLGRQTFSGSSEDCLTNIATFEYEQWEAPTTPAKRAQAIADFSSDSLIKISAIQFINNAPKDVYVYEFTYASPFGLQMFNTSLWMGAVHASELSFVFGAPFAPLTFFGTVTPSDDDKKVSENIMTFWTNFAKTGNPNTATPPTGATTWQTYNATGDQEYIVLDETCSMTKHYPRWEMYRFWTEMMPNFMKYDCVKADNTTTTTSAPVTTTTAGGSSNAIVGFSTVVLAAIFSNFAR